MLERIVSGGQAGVDRAALDAALAVGIPCGGWCPRGRRAADGVIPHHYPLRETQTSDYTERTRCNVRDADATLVLHCSELSGGTLRTVQIARELDKPLLCVNLAQTTDRESVLQWLERNAVHTLNVAGPREQERWGIYHLARAWLQGLFDTLWRN
jgi:predicted Rossmann fold nucleotide-binding protein DprA/Smf involved in DNA uptake